MDEEDQESAKLVDEKQRTFYANLFTKDENEGENTVAQSDNKPTKKPKKPKTKKKNESGLKQKFEAMKR